MSESSIKGDLFLKALDQVVIKWGKNGLDIIEYGPARYRSEQWYPFQEMCTLLSTIKSRLGNNNPLAVYQLGFKTMKEDGRWQGIFDDMDPVEVFLSTSRQDAQYRVGRHEAIAISPKHVRIELHSDDPDPLWLEFYRGRLQGVLELTGRTGVVHLLPQSGGATARVYDIKWG